MRFGTLLAALVCSLAAPAAAQAGVVNLTLSSGKLTLTGTAEPDTVTIDYQALDDPAGKPARFEIISADGTTLTGACTFSSSTNRECTTASVSSFQFEGGDGNDKLYLVDEDPLVRGSDLLTANMGAGDDRVDTSSAYLGRLPSTTWSDAITANGDDGGDYLEGSTGGDTINGGAGNDSVSASTGDDTVSGGADNDTLRGGSNNDSINGGSGDDALFGDSGDDTLTPSTGTDTVDGGSGGDVASYADRITIGFLGITASPVNVSLDGAANDGAAREGDNIGAGVENLTGGSAGDVLTGDDLPNVILGGGGDDEVHGRGGGDVLDGQADSDFVRGGGGPDDLRDTGTTGADTIDYGDAPAAVRVDLAGGPSMGVEADPDTLAPAFEHAGGGPGDDDLNGNAAGNRLAGGPGNDTLDGLAGDDTLLGGEGNDKLNAGDGVDTATGEAGNDTVDGGAGSDPTLDGGDGADVVLGGPGGPDDADGLAGGQGRDQISYAGRITGVSVTMDGVANDGGIGERDNVGSDFEGLRGGEGPDTLRLTAVVRLALVYVPILRPVRIPITTIRPRTAAQRLAVVEPGRFVVGGGGNDTIIGSAGNDALSGGLGKDKVTGGAGNDAVHGGSGDDTTDGGDGNDRVYGDEGHDLLIGGKGFDVLFAADKAGRDKADCGDDNDTLLRDPRDQAKKVNPCERAVGTDKLKLPDKVGDPQDGDELFGPEGDDFADTDDDGLLGEDDWSSDFGTESFDDFGAEFDDSFFGFDELGDFGDASEIAGSVMKLATAKAKVKGRGFKLSLQCPKEATRRCVGEIVVSITKKGKEKELASELFRTNRGKRATLSLKFRAKLKSLIPKGKKGVTARVVVEARDSGDLLFGLDTEVNLRR